MIGADGTTAPVFGYTDAIRQHVLVDSDFDSDGDGVNDKIAVDIIRPAASDQGLKVPVIMDDSPYYSTLGRGNESQLKVDDANGLLSKWPLFLDNYFVPRGYAVVLVDMTGTNKSTGCPTIQGTTDNLAGPEVIDWLNGRRTAHDSQGNLVTVDWHNGKTGMIGKSYDGALSAAAAVTGVQGLSTIVDESGPYNYYDYTRTNGIVQRGNHYLANSATNSGSLAVTITADSSARQALTARPAWDAISAQDGDSTGDYSPFWDPRNYIKDANKVKASVFVEHGLNDENVRPDHFSKWWYALAANNVPRKLWLSQEGHVDPFDWHRGLGVAGDGGWVDTLHRWFDYWLQGVDNGIMSEPRVTIETAPNTYENDADWPLPGTVNQDVYLRSGATATTAGSLALSTGGALASRTFTDNNSSENSYINTPTGSQTNRLVFVSPALTHDLRISGTPSMDVWLSSSKTQSNLTAFLVDYGSGTYVSRTNDGVTTSTTLPEQCFGLSSPTDDACYKQITKVTQALTTYRVTKGMLDSSNRDSLTTPTPMTVGTKYEFKWPLLPNDFTFKAGHQIGVVIGANFSAYSTTNGTTAAQLTVDTKLSKISLPVVGGYSTARASGAFAADTAGPTVTVPPTITKEATGPTTPVSYTVTVADNEDPNPTVTCAPVSGSSFPVGDTTVSCDGVDDSGNHTAASFHVVVTDTTPPTVDTHADIPSVEATSPAGAAVTFTAPASHDLVDGDAGSTCSPASGSTFAKGSTTVTCSKTDAHSNTGASTFTVTVVDTTAPVTSATVSPAAPDGLNGWYVSNPLITLSAQDTASAVTSTEYAIDAGSWTPYAAPFHLCSAAIPCGKHPVGYRSTDAAGNVEVAKSLSLWVDLTNPTSSASISPAERNGWYASPTVTLTGQDGAGSGIDHISYRVDGGPWKIYASPLGGFSTGNHFVQFQATDVAGRVEPTTHLVAFKADAVKPSVTITAPADGATIPLDKVTTAKFKCTDGESGIASCTGTVANGANLATSTVGSHAFTVTATDLAGNVTAKTVHYSVTYTFNGFFQPISNESDQQLNLVHAGDLIKIGFSLNGNRGLNIFAAGSPSTTLVGCPTWNPHIVSGASTGSTAGVTFGVASGHYTYGWQTSPGWAGTCRRLSIQTDDGTPPHTAVFMFFA